MTKLLVFAGSTRQQSFNRQLAHATAKLARASGADVTQLELSDFDIPMYNADLEAEGTPADVIRLKEILDAHPAWIIVSPEYNGSYTALLKNTIDWASSPVKGHPVWSRRQQALYRQSGGPAQRIARRTGRPALAQPPEPAAAKPAVLDLPPAICAGPRWRSV